MELLRSLLLEKPTDEVGQIFSRVASLPGNLPKILRKIGAASRFRTGEMTSFSVWVALKPGFVDMPLFRAASKEDSFLGVRATSNSVILVFDKNKIGVKE